MPETPLRKLLRGCFFAKKGLQTFSKPANVSISPAAGASLVSRFRPFDLFSRPVFFCDWLAHRFPAASPCRLALPPFPAAFPCRPRITACFEPAALRQPHSDSRTPTATLRSACTPVYRYTSLPPLRSAATPICLHSSLPLHLSAATTVCRHTCLLRRVPRPASDFPIRPTVCAGTAP